MYNIYKFVLFREKMVMVNNQNKHSQMYVPRTQAPVKGSHVEPGGQWAH